VEVLPREGNAKLQVLAVKIEGSADASEARPWASFILPEKKSGSKPSGDGGDKSPLMAQKNESSVFWIKREGFAVVPDQE